MSDQFPPTISQPTGTPVKLWTSSAVGITTFFLGFPGGIVLASINWFRMGLKNKAVAHLVVGAIGAFAISVFAYFAPATINRLLSIIVNVGIVYYLSSQTKKDTEAFVTNNHIVKKESGWIAFLIGVGMLIFYFVAVFIMVFFFAFLGF